jgi:hypothetical protein
MNSSSDLTKKKKAQTIYTQFKNTPSYKSNLNLIYKYKECCTGQTGPTSYTGQTIYTQSKNISPYELQLIISLGYNSCCTGSTGTTGEFLNSRLQ